MLHEEEHFAKIVGLHFLPLDGANCSPKAPGAADGAPRPYRLQARRAIVVAGGAFGTPELLLRSGFRSPSGMR